MEADITMATGVSGLNVLLLAVLAVIWVRNYLAFRSRLVLGLVVFAAVMLLENALAIYYFFTMKMLYSSDPGVQTAVATLRSLQFIALVFLTWVTAK